MGANQQVAADQGPSVCIRAGVLVLVVGPSGAGKDTLIAYAKAQLEGDTRFVFIRRVVTRQGDAQLEDHANLAPAEFADALAAGAFALHWRAHGLGYGLPASMLDHLAEGRVVVANTSRGVIDQARALAPRLVVAHVQAASEVLAQRLVGRGREDFVAIVARLRREAPPVSASEAVEIVNNGAVATAGDQLVALLQNCAAAD